VAMGTSGDVCRSAGAPIVGRPEDTVHTAFRVDATTGAAVVGGRTPSTDVSVSFVAETWFPRTQRAPDGCPAEPGHVPIGRGEPTVDRSATA
jgi:hypothetical protein